MAAQPSAAARPPGPLDRFAKAKDYVFIDHALAVLALKKPEFGIRKFGADACLFA